MCKAEIVPLCNKKTQTVSGSWLSFGCWMSAVVAHYRPWSSTVLRVSWKMSKGRTFGFTLDHFPGLVACNVWERVAWQVAGGGAASWAKLLICSWGLTRQDLPSEKTIKMSWICDTAWRDRFGHTENCKCPFFRKRPLPLCFLARECHQPLLCSSLGYSTHLPEQMSYLKNVCNFSFHKLLFN